MRFLEPDQNRRVSLDRRSTEIERLQGECEELRVRERKALAEAEEAKERLARLTSTSKAFAASIRGRTDERKRAGRRLTAQYAVGRVLAEAADLDDAIPKILKILGEGLGWSLGAFWAVDAGALRCDAFWCSSNVPPSVFEDAYRRSSFPCGVGLPGRVWAENASVWVEDVLAEDDFLRRKEAAAEEGLRGALAFPIRDGEVLGVVELFCRKVSPLDEEMLRTAALIGDQVGQFVRRQRAEEELRGSEELYRLMTENSTDMISKHTPEGAYVYASPACRSLLGYKPEELAGRSAYEFFHPDDLAAIREAHSSILKLPDTYTVSYRIRRKDGSYVWFETTSRTIRDPKTNAVQEIIAASRDVTERKQAEEERERSLARELQIRAQAEERRRISRELHDRVAHSMAVVHQSLELHEALKERDPAAAEAKMDLARKMAKEALTSTRNLSMELRRPEVRRGLEAALADLLRDVVPPTCRSELVVEGDEGLVLPHIRNQLFPILREAVRNAVAHSGCDRVTVELDITPQRVAGTVEDDGRGFVPTKTRSNGGLRSMKERVTLLGGTFGVSSKPDEGTRVNVSVPLDDS